MFERAIQGEMVNSRDYHGRFPRDEKERTHNPERIGRALALQRDDLPAIYATIRYLEEQPAPISAQLFGKLIAKHVGKNTSTRIANVAYHLDERIFECDNSAIGLNDRHCLDPESPYYVE